MTMESEFQSQSLDHLGIVAGMIDHLELVETLDDLLPQDDLMRNISISHSCKALILMSLGYTQRTLYMVSDYFSKRPVEALIEPSVSASMLNDSALWMHCMRMARHVYSVNCR